MSYITDIHNLSKFTSNDILNKINNLFQNDVEFKQNVVVDGNLSVNGTTVSINTDSYSAENLDLIGNTTSNAPILKITELSQEGNIVEIYKNTTSVITVDNAGNLITSNITVHGDFTIEGKFNNVAVSELGHLKGTNDNIQSQLDNKQNVLTAGSGVNISGDVISVETVQQDTFNDINSSNIHVSGNLTLEGNINDVAVSELGHLKGTNDNIQSQLDNKQNVLTAGSGVNISGDVISVETVQQDTFNSSNIHSLNIKTNNISLFDPSIFNKNDEVRMYPPVHNFTYDASTVEGRSSLHVVSDQAYGNGTYKVEMNHHMHGYRLFSDSENWSPGQLHYGGYIGSGFGATDSNGLVDDFHAWWVTLKLPDGIFVKMSRFEFSSATSETLKLFKIYGSKNGIEWDELFYSNTIMNWDADGKIGADIESHVYYKYFGFALNDVGGKFSQGATFGSWYIYGYEGSDPQLKIDNSLDVSGDLTIQGNIISKNLDMNILTPVSTSSGYQIQCNRNGNNYQFTNTTNWSIASDKRIKTEISEADYKLCYDNIHKLSLNRYKFIDGIQGISNRDKYRLGYIAQDVEKIFPKNIITKPMTIYDHEQNKIQVINDCLSIDTDQIQMSLYGAFKHMMTKIEDLEHQTSNLLVKLNSTT